MKLKKSALSLMVCASLLTYGLPVSAELSNAEKTEVTNAITKVDSSFDANLENAEYYRKYIVEGLYDKDYYNAESFESLIYGEVRTYVEAGGLTVTLIEKSGKLTATAEETLQYGKDVAEMAKEAEQIKSVIDEEIAETKFCSFPMLYMSMTYFKATSGSEYIVLYFNDSYGTYEGVLESGKLYSAKEFLSQLNTVYNIADYNSDEDLGIPSTGIMGDVNRDGKVDARDCSSMSKHLAASRFGMLDEMCDYNNDGAKNVRDVAAIAKFLATGK